MTPFKNWKVWHYLTVFGLAFAMGCAEVIKADIVTGFAIPQDAAGWEALAQAVALGGIAAVIALYRTKPGHVSVPVAELHPTMDPSGFPKEEKSLK